MELKENVWYVIDEERHRANFIIALSIATKLTERELRTKCDNFSLYKAKVFKWKTKSIDPFIVDINYRSEFRPEYLKGEVVHYKPTYAFGIEPVDLAAHKDNSILTSNVIEQWVDTRIADMERNTMTKIYEGDNNMICSNEYNEKYLIQQYFEAEEKKLTDERNQAENDLLKNIALYKTAEAFIETAKANKGYDCSTPTVRYLIRDYLNEAQFNALSKLNEKYNEKLEEVRKKCRVVESLINMSDTVVQKMDILRRYEIIKLPKMPK